MVSESNQKNSESQNRYRPGVPSSDPDWGTGKKETVKVVYLFSSESEFGVGIAIESENQGKPESIPTRSSELRPRLENRKKRNSKSRALLSESEFGVGIGIELCKQRIENRYRPGVPSSDPDWGISKFEILNTHSRLSYLIPNSYFHFNI